MEYMLKTTHQTLNFRRNKAFIIKWVLITLIVFFVIAKRRSIIYSQEKHSIPRYKEKVATYSQEKDSIPQYQEKVASHFQKKPLKRILLWLPHINGHGNKEHYKECLTYCPAKCEMTTDKTDIQNVDAIDYHLSNLWAEFWKVGTRSTIEFPKYRRSDQIWIVSNLEPPCHLWGDLKVFNGLFNWTRWYRFDATIPWTYGFSHKLNEEQKDLAKERMRGRNIFKEKTNEIIGRVSHCQTQSGREKIIKEMLKHLAINWQGKCYGKPCGAFEKYQNITDVQCDNVLASHKFFIAFENSFCKDYVTEKYWGAISRLQIPIVNWKMDYSRLVIPGSYINIYDFKDVKTLTDYIKEVGRNETLYNSYFDWTTNYADYGICSPCEICKALHDKRMQPQVVEDLDGWVKDDTCTKVEPPKQQKP